MQLNKIDNFFILPLICSAAVLRKEKYFRELLSLAKIKRIPSKKIYEALLQNYLFAGYPSALEALKIYNEYFPRKERSKRDDFNHYHFRKSGELNCRKIYGDKFEKLISNINSFSPEMSDWLVLEGYGKVLSRKNLSLLEREYFIISVLTALMFEDQLYSHINGAFRQGAKEIKVREVIKNLSILGEKQSVKIGLKIFDKYLKKRAENKSAP